MKNPGLDAFSAATTFAEKPRTHPIWGDPDADVDPDRRPSDDEQEESDYMPPPGGIGKNDPGASRRSPIPTFVGPRFRPEESPEDVIQGEVISPEEEDAASRVFKGEHESDHPSDNPYVERARQDLHTPGADDAVSTLSGLLRGHNPEDVGGLDEAHDYLKRHFDRMTVNPHTGHLIAHSPYGTQLVKRETHLPAVPDEPSEHLYSLTSKHGEVKSADASRIVKTMLALQIIHNTYGSSKKDDDDDGLTSTSGVMDMAKNLLRSMVQDHPSGTPGGLGQRRIKPVSVIPHSAVFEPGQGQERGPNGKNGGYVVPIADAPAGWHKHLGMGVAYSPEHNMSNIFDPKKAVLPRPDPRFSGHTLTYAQNNAEGYTNKRTIPKTDIDYWVKDAHPAARGPGFDHPAADDPTPPPPPPSGRPPRHLAPVPDLEEDGPATPHSPYEETYHFSDDYDDLPPLTRPSRFGPPPTGFRPRTSAVSTNDLCPVCASGYLEPYSAEHHECLNCGSLVSKTAAFTKSAARRNYEDEPTGDELDDLFAEHDRLPEHPDSDLPAGETKTYRLNHDSGEFESPRPDWEDEIWPRHAARPKGGLGRGLGQIIQPEGDPLNLSAGGSEADDFVAPDAGVHPLADEENQNPDEVYQAPQRILGSADRDRLLDLGATGVKCTVQSCGAEADEPCKTPSGQPTRPHAARINRYVNHYQRNKGKLAAAEPDEIDKHMVNLGYQPIHKAGQPRMYSAKLPGMNGRQSALLMEGTNGGWVLGTKGGPWDAGERWDQGGQPYTKRKIDVPTVNPGTKAFGLPSQGDRGSAEMSILATGHHPIEDPRLAWAIEDLAKNGRNSQVYHQPLLNSAFEPKQLPDFPEPAEGDTKTPYSEAEQRRLRGFSSTELLVFPVLGNPGLSRWNP